MASPIPPVPPQIAPVPSDSYKRTTLPPPYTEFYSPGGPSRVGALNLLQVPSSSVPVPPHYQQAGFPGAQISAYVPVPPHAIRGVPLPPQFPFTPPRPGPHSYFGPTPLNDRQMLLPYAFYMERGIVDARARWRFVEGLLCALGIYLGVVFLIGVEAVGDGWLFRRLGNEVVVPASS